MFMVEHLSKQYPFFSLKDISFELPPGYITGFIGVNGAGKTTTLKSILNIVKPDTGKITFLGKDMTQNECELKQKIGFMLGPIDFYTRIPVYKVIRSYRRFYTEWNDKVFNSYMTRFQIDARKKIGELSMGMRVKLGIAMALSHNASLIILDEPTSGLDPVARDGLLDLMREVVEDGSRSILFSTHITSDLDKCADYLLFIRKGELIANDTKDDLLESHLLISGKTADLTPAVKKAMIDYKVNAFGFSGLTLKKDYLTLNERLKLSVEKPNLEAIMLYYNLEVANHA